LRLQHMSENIEGGIYGAEVSYSDATSLLVEEANVVSEPTEEHSEPNGEEAAVEVQTQEIEQPDKAEDAHPSVEPIDVDGTNYSLEDLKLAIDDSRNRSDWQKSNTQKAQQLADDRKHLDQVRKKYDDLLQDEDLRETLKDYLGPDHALFTETDEPNVDVQTPQDTKDSDQENRIQELEDKVEMQNAQQAVERDIQALIRNHPELNGEESAIQDVLITASKKGMSNLEDAFVLTYHQATVDSSFSKAVKTLEKASASKSIPEASVKHKGSKSLSNVKPKDFDDARAQALKSYDLYE